MDLQATLGRAPNLGDADRVPASVNEFSVSFQVSSSYTKDDLHQTEQLYEKLKPLYILVWHV